MHRLSVIGDIYMKAIPHWAIECGDTGTRQGPVKSSRPSSKKSAKKSSAKKNSSGKKR
jgi:hypothetical protein